MWRGAPGIEQCALTEMHYLTTIKKWYAFTVRCKYKNKINNLSCLWVSTCWYVIIAYLQRDSIRNVGSNCKHQTTEELSITRCWNSHFYSATVSLCLSPRQFSSSQHFGECTYLFSCREFRGEYRCHNHVCQLNTKLISSLWFSGGAGWQMFCLQIEPG